MTKQAKDASTDPVQSAAAAAGHLYEAKERFKDAASAVVGAVKSAATTAASAAREDIGAGADAIRDPLSDAAAAAGAAVSEARAAAGAEVEVMMEKGKELLASTGNAIRKHPVAAFGAALAVGWLIAKLGRRD
ncbi:MAG: hypothetical protein R3F10_10225 [Lysobacteraceae bacterium]